MTLPLPPAPEKYERDKIQALFNAVAELQRKVFMPKDEDFFTDKNDGKNKKIFVDSGTLTVDDA